jgi:copper chaperone CopZ
MLASAAMSFSSVCVVLNALRLRKINLLPKQKNHQKGEEDMLFSKKTVTYAISVEGMMCQHCVAHVKKALDEVKGVKAVEVSLEEKRATVTASCAPSALTAAITAAGYTAGEVKEI